MFGRNGYRQLLSLISASGYEFNNVLEELKNNDCFLRHDVDFSIDYALDLAVIESEIGVKSSYFFMLTSNMYNLLSKENIEKVLKIKSLGHSISLHFDPDCYEDFHSGFVVEKSIFENTFQVDLKLISIHRPGKFLENNDEKLPNVTHTYETKFFKDIEYISDSAGANPREKLEKFLKSNTYRPLQLLVHPIWWVSYSETPSETLNNWLEETSIFIKKEISINCRSYEG
jgi:hypothetical protein